METKRSTCTVVMRLGTVATAMLLCTLMHGLMEYFCMHKFLMPSSKIPRTFLFIQEFRNTARTAWSYYSTVQYRYTKLA